MVYIKACGADLCGTDSRYRLCIALKPVVAAASASHTLMRLNAASQGVDGCPGNLVRLGKDFLTPCD